MEEILKAIEEMKNDFEKRFNSIDDQLKRMEDSLDRMEFSNEEDIKGFLDRIDKNTKDIRQDVDFLSEKVGKHEMTLDRLNKS